MRRQSTKPLHPCLDCGKPVSPRSVRCRSCAQRFRWESPDDARREHLRQRNASVRDGRRPYEDREWLRVRYEDRGMSLRDIAKEAGCSLRTIARWMETHSIPRLDNAEALRLRAPRITGYGNPNWRGLANVKALVRQWSYDHWRPTVMERDRYVCQRCGCDNRQRLNAHHRIPLDEIIQARQRKWNPDLRSAKGRIAFIQRLLRDPAITALENGETLCVPCHKKAHRAGSRRRKPRQLSLPLD